MPYDLKFNIETSGADALTQIDAIVARLGTSTGVSAGQLKLFEQVLREEVQAGNALGAALKTVASSTDAGSAAIAKMAKEVLGIGRGASSAERDIQKLGRTMEIAYAENRARDLKKINDELKAQSAAARAAASETQKLGRLMEIANAENRARDLKKITDELKASAAATRVAAAESNKAGSAFLALAAQSGLVSGEVGGITRSVGMLAGGLGSLVAPATLATVGILGMGVAVAKTGFDLVREFSGAELETANLASRLSITVQQAEKLSSMARLTGVNISSLEQSARLLGEALENPTGTGKRAADALEKLGIATVGLKGGLKDTGPIVLELLDKLAKIPDAATRFALAQETLGRGSKVLQPLIADYDELQRTVAELHVGDDALGSKELLDADRQIKTLDEAWTLFKKHLAERISPIVIPIVAGLLGHIDGLPDAAPGPSVAPNPVQRIRRLPAEPLGSSEAAMFAARAAFGEHPPTTSGAEFRARDNRTKESLEAQLKDAKAAAEKLRPDLRSDSIDKETRTRETAEYNKQEKEIARVEAALKALNGTKKEANRADEEAITLRAEHARIQAGELSGLDAIVAKHDALIEKLKEEDALYQKEHKGEKPNPKLTAANRALIDANTSAEIEKYAQRENILQAQSERSVGNSRFTEVRRLEKAKAEASAAIDMAQGKSAGSEEAAVESAFRTRIAAAKDELEQAARHIDDLVKTRDEKQRDRPDADAVRKDNEAIDIAANKAAVDFQIAGIEAIKQHEISLNDLKRRQFQDDLDHARALRTVSDATLHADVEDARAGLARRAAIIGAQADSGPGHELDTLRAQLDLRRQIAQVERDERQAGINAGRAEQAAILAHNPDDAAAAKSVEAELAKLRAEEITNQRGYERELGDERIDIELKVAEIRKQSEKEYQEFAVGIVNATLKGGKATGDFLREYGHKMLDQVVSNVASMTFDSVSKVMPTVGGQSDAQGKPTGLGKLLAGVPLFGNQAGAAQKALADVTAAQKAAHVESGPTEALAGHVDQTTAAVDRVRDAIERLGRTPGAASNIPTDLGGGFGATSGGGVADALGSLLGKTGDLGEASGGGAGDEDTPSIAHYASATTSALNLNTTAVASVFHALTGHSVPGVAGVAGAAAAVGALGMMGGDSDGPRPSLSIDSPNYSPTPTAGGGTAAMTKGGAGPQYGGLSGLLGGLGHTGDLQGILSGVSSGKNGSESLSSAERIGGAIGSAGAVAAGAYTAVSQFKKGGAGGALGGTGAILGTAALFDPEPISKAVLGAVAGISGLLSGMFGSTPQKREAALSKELTEHQYIAPQSMNVVESTSGKFADFDYKGNLRTSTFSPYPQERQASLWEQTHGGLFGSSPSTYYNVPGGQTAQFGAQMAPPAAPQTVNHYSGTVIQGNLNAIDTQSGAQFIQSHSHTVANAAAAAMQNGHGALTSEVHRAATGR